MANSFIKKLDQNENEGIDEHIELLNNIFETKKNLQKCYNNMQYVKDDKLLDYYTYKIKSYESQYDFLVKEAKKILS